MPRVAVLTSGGIAPCLSASIGGLIEKYNEIFVYGSTRLRTMIIKPVDWRVGTLFFQSRHYSAVVPRLTKHWLGAYVDEELKGILTLGWGTNPMGTIKKMFSDLTTEDYYEIGKMCMDDSMLRNSESQLLSKTIQWIKDNTPKIKYLYTWADGIVGKPG